MVQSLCTFCPKVTLHGQCPWSNEETGTGVLLLREPEAYSGLTSVAINVIFLLWGPRVAFFPIKKKKKSMGPGGFWQVLGARSSMRQCSLSLALCPPRLWRQRWGHSCGQSPATLTCGRGLMNDVVSELALVGWQAHLIGVLAP